LCVRVSEGAAHGAIEGSFGGTYQQSGTDGVANERDEVRDHEPPRLYGARDRGDSNVMEKSTARERTEVRI
jgi:hypothetical protein